MAKSERKSNLQYIFIKDNRLKGNGFHPVLCLERSERNGYKYEKSYFDYKFALIVGILPFIFLILSQGAITNFIIVKVFNSNRQISEFVFYFLSRQIVWAMWLGFALGTSVRLAFKRRLKHEVIYKMEQAHNLF